VSLILKNVIQKLKSFHEKLKYVFHIVSDYLNRDPKALGKYSNVQLTSSVTYNYSSVNTLNKKRVVYCFVSMALLLILQESVFNDLRIFGVKPNLALVVLFLFSSYLNVQKSMYIGLFLGLYVDIIYGNFFGLFALQFMYIGMFSSLITPLRFKGNKIWQLITALPIFIIYTLFEGLIARFVHLFLGGGSVYLNNFNEMMTNKIMPVVLYDYIAFLILVVPVFAIWYKLGGKEKVLYM